jgi:S-adenosylmethionine:tRNA ribosyltransferase-isomerase
LKTSDFFYHLPKEFIAQQPVSPRDSSRLLVYDRAADRIDHRSFSELGEFLKENDLLVLNRTKVIRARVSGKKIPTGGKIELLLLRETAQDQWEAMVGGKGVNVGTKLQLLGGPEGVILKDLGRSIRLIHFTSPINDLITEIGEVPLPPYIQEELREPERYQTIYAQDSGSAAAPTAGLHFTPQLLEKIRAQGVRVAEVTLHIGLDTFAPVHEEDPREHQIHTEWCQLTEKVAEKIQRVRKRGGRVIAVGTTSVRTLETAGKHSQDLDRIQAFEGPTDLYILPGFDFQIVDCMLTNFHLPESTLLMLVSAFTGREKLLSLYELAIREKYRFYSFGDAMLLI